MKRIYLTAGALLVWSTSALAGVGGETVTIPADDYKAIMQQMKALQQRVETLENKGKVTGDSAERKQAAAIPGKLEKDVQSIYATLDAVETKTLKDRLNLGAELRTRVDGFKLKDHMMLGGMNSVDHNDNYWTNRFRLNMDAEIKKNLLFTGRVTAYKTFANDDNVGLVNDANQAHVPGNSGLKLDRAYIDWIPEGLPVPLAITFGRHPSSEGPPSELKENRLRQSTYPSLLFDGEADGVVATVGLERYLGWKNSGVRFAWGKAYQDTNSSNAGMPYTDTGGMYDDSNVYAMFFETEIPGVKDSLLVLSALQVADLVGDPSYLGGAGAIRDIGDMSLFGIHAQANNVKDSGFDLFMSLGLNKSDPNGNLVDTDNPVDGIGDVGLLNNDGTTEHSGWAIHTGLRYTIPYKQWNNPKVGFEFNHGSDYWFSFTWGSAELYNKLATRGEAYDIYYIQPFNENLFGRVGYTHINYSAPMSGMHMGDYVGGEAGEMDNAYFLLDARF